MVLFVDETENDQLFIVTGVLADSDLDVVNAYGQSKKSVRGFRIPDKYKSIVFTEFKSTLLDKDYNKIKIKMLETISNSGFSIIYSVYFKKALPFNQTTKESIYIDLLTNIVSVLDQKTDVVFDSFGNRDFESKIVNKISALDPITAVKPMNSQCSAGLQFADNVCSVVRHHQMNDKMAALYQYISKNTKRV